MVKDELKDEIKRMLKAGYTYRQIREALGVGHWTITRVKRELEREEEEERLKEYLALELDEFARQWKRLVRGALRDMSKLTDEKLKDLWDYWHRIEFEEITIPLFVDRYINACVKPMIYCYYFNLLWDWAVGLLGLLRSMPCIR